MIQMLPRCISLCLDDAQSVHLNEVSLYLWIIVEKCSASMSPKLQAELYLSVLVELRD